MPTLAAQRDAAQQLAAGLGVPHRCDVPLGPLTWYGIGGAAAVFAQPVDVPQLQTLVRAAHEQDVPLYVLGSGANLLVADEGVAGIVIKLDSPAFIEVRIESPRVIAAAGYDLPRLITRTAKAGLGGLEALAGIPASVGGAIRMNAGGAFGDIGKHVSRVRIMQHDGSISDLHRDALRFDYRSSHIDAPFILEAEFELIPGDATAQLAAPTKTLRPRTDTAQRTSPTHGPPTCPALPAH
jgi:UDP-N-acetylmuramate dehydrogenase